ncbi:hypothetical protein N2152v2_004817 [Parachlorella kessleri]
MRPFFTARILFRRQQGGPVVVRAEGGQKQEEATTSQQPASPRSTRPEDEPIWVRRERERELQAKEGGKDLPFGVYLLFSAIVAIAAVGSVFEYFNRHAIFDVIQPENPLWAPVLGVFVFTGLPMAGALTDEAAAAKAEEGPKRLRVPALIVQPDSTMLVGFLSPRAAAAAEAIRSSAMAGAWGLAHK